MLTHTCKHAHTYTLSLQLQFPLSPTQAYTHLQTHSHKHMQTRKHTHPLTYKHTQTHANTRKHTHTHANTRTHTQTHAFTHSLTRKNTHTHAISPTCYPDSHLVFQISSIFRLSLSLLIILPTFFSLFLFFFLGGLSNFCSKCRNYKLESVFSC